jgi:L-alanine-DL-glutamate epimerase-like enolase superfamily enzyme
MRIVAIEPMIVEVPMRTPVKGVHGVTRTQRSVLVRITTDADVEGWGNVDPSPGYTLMSADEIHTMINAWAPNLVGSDAMNLNAAQRQWIVRLPAATRPRRRSRWRSAMSRLGRSAFRSTRCSAGVPNPR